MGAGRARWLAVAGLLAAWLQPARAQEDTSQSAPPPPPAAETVLPRTGIDPTVSDLREHLLQSYGDAEPNLRPSGPDLQITGQLGASEQYNSNVGLSGGTASGSRGDDFITLLQPGISIVDTSQRLRVNLDYNPTGQIYARNGSYSQFAQQFDGDILATALPGWIYADLRGAVSQSSIFGGVGPSNTVTLAPNDRQTDSSVSFTPYLDRQFGTHGSVNIGAGYIYSTTDAPGTNLGPRPFDGTGAYGSSYLATTRGFASYETGEDLGRIRNRIGTDDSFYQGGGALADGHRLLFTDDVSYALTRLVTLLAEAGYEDLNYPRSDFSYTGPVASGGLKLTPKPGSYLTVEYRYLDGFGSAFVQGSVQVSPRIRVFGGYSAGISTYQQDQQASLLDSGLDSTGAAASVLQAAPLLQSDNSFGANQNLTRTHRLDATASYLGDRNTATLSVSQQTTTPVGRQLGQFAQVSTNGLFGSASLSRQLTPDLSLSGYVQYGRNNDGLVRGNTAGSGQTVSVSVAVNRVFTRTLSGYVQFGGTYLVGGSSFGASGEQGLGNGQTTVTLGAVKRF